ncbi:SIR2-like domain-containing protein [Burkholderia sp. D7]|nr:SIR2-like domain-containing protein [Burkholderia sp. D7]
MLETQPDFPALKKLAEALWQQDAQRQGAAIMIGAGFSRGASKHADGTRKLPLWRGFARRLATELDENDEMLPFADPLRLAEEYRSYFGNAALSDLIRQEIDDEALQPGPLHNDLLGLPWSEVMTTNWDTLLERAASRIHTPVYGVVTKQSDLAHVKAPRIVKLHGTIGVTDKFVVAQEDYRKYPEDFAAFVNFARHVFIENELCLLGFSGDDPNFMQWAGWVRDRLASHARKIYLVGALNLSASRRKILESINVAPIDLWDVVRDIDDHDLKHERATELFLAALVERKPKPDYEWEPTRLVHPAKTADDNVRLYRDAEYGASLISGQLDTYRRDRESYPGWLVCPPQLRWQVQSQISSPRPTKTNLAALPSATRSAFLYEIAWRHETAWDPIDPWLGSELASIADPSCSCGISKRQQLEVFVLFVQNLAVVACAASRSEGRRSHGFRAIEECANR